MLDFGSVMQKKVSELSVFFPTYNEEGNIGKTVKDAKNVLSKVALRWEIIIVNDGSADKTKEVSEKLARSDKRIRLVNHKINKGYGGALKTGFDSAKYRWVAFTDADGQFDFSEIAKFVDKADSADLILGYRLKRADSLSRKVLTFWWNALARLLLGLPARDYSCGFKLIRKDVFNKVSPLIGEEKVTQIEMLVKARKLGFVFDEIGVHHYPRAMGKQTGANLGVFVKSVLGLFRLWWQLR